MDLLAQVAEKGIVQLVWSPKAEKVDIVVAKPPNQRCVVAGDFFLFSLFTRVVHTLEETTHRRLYPSCSLACVVDVGWCPSLCLHIARGFGNPQDSLPRIGQFGYGGGGGGYTSGGNVSSAAYATSDSGGEEINSMLERAPSRLSRIGEGYQGSE